MPADDFRFLSGHFRVSHRRLADRLTGSTEWSEFDTLLWGYPVLGGAALIDEMRGEFEGEVFWGMTIRTHDPAADEWTLHWTDTVHRGLGSPMRGRFVRTRGKFFGRERWRDVDVDVRFTWTVVPGEPPRWEQAYSGDGGRSWETNWVMVFHRIDGGTRHPDRAF